MNIVEKRRPEITEMEDKMTAQWMPNLLHTKPPKVLNFGEYMQQHKLQFSTYQPSTSVTIVTQL